MAEIDLTVIESDQPEAEAVSLKSPPKPKPKHYDVPEVEVSKRIAKYDWKIKHKVILDNPYAFNSISLKKNQANVAPTQTADQLITVPLYNKVGKFLGVDTVREWNQYYDKVYEVVGWAKKEVGSDVAEKIISFLTQKSRSIPSLGARRIDDLYIHAHMRLKK